ncbi:MAG: hypothetical protein IPH05_12305 [Flavobacteriales bacterium]|nr:hypothetical protein [Flavobacteriales bacterium]MBK7101040.1 hypothetical protein [Flavobacteriales bacterium]
MKILKFIPIAAILLAASSTTTNAIAQDKPDVNFIAQTTMRIVVPEGGAEKEMWDMMKEYFDKVYAKSTIVKHCTIYRHAYGSEGRTMVVNTEFATWADIEKFDEEREALEKAGWPDEAKREAFMKKMGSFQDPYHHDEIYSISNTMRK